jgi:hypothetical protein
MSDSAKDPRPARGQYSKNMRITVSPTQARSLVFLLPNLPANARLSRKLWAAIDAAKDGHDVEVKLTHRQQTKLAALIADNISGLLTLVGRLGVGPQSAPYFQRLQACLAEK